ncbi:rho GTPase-activating protein 4-like, partial [Cetorhinus maximus]
AQGADIRAVVKFDYPARSGKELSLRKGEPLLLFHKVSDDWWTGQIGGVKGLVPHKYIELTDTTDGFPEVPSDSANELAPSEKATGSSRHSSVSVAIQERRNTLDLMQLSHRPDRTAAGKLDRQYSDKPASELNKEIVKNMDSVFRELLQVKRLKASGEESQDPGKAESLAGQGVTLRRSSSGALEKPASKQGTPSKPSMKSRAAALFKSSAGGTADGSPKVTS